MRRKSQESDENRRLRAQERLILEVTEGIWEVLAQRGCDKACLAEALGMSVLSLTQLLNGSRDLTLRVLADIALHLEVQVKIRFMAQKPHGRSAVVTLSTEQFMESVGRTRLQAVARRMALRVLVDGWSAAEAGRREGLSRERARSAAARVARAWRETGGSPEDWRTLTLRVDATTADLITALVHRARSRWFRGESPG
ncbi:MAG: helix-turn-helix domain-containing protein [Acidiferrobacteraceae bacterium]